jgi:Spy/CpxP family protein refolding chaperone
MKRFLTMGLMMGVLILLSASVQAQPFDGRGRGGHGGHGRWDKMAGNFENLRMLKLLEVLDLSEEQSEKFIPLFHTFRKDMRALNEKKRDIVMRLSGLIDSTGTDEEIMAEIDNLRAVKRELDALIDTFADKVSEVLTAKQLGQFIIFQERFEREILKSLREFRQPPEGFPPIDESEGK